MTPEQLEKLLNLSKEACSFAYVPYSNFKVGVALLTTDGKFFTGCNVENASYGLSICAERTALVKAVSEGYHEFIAIAVYSDTYKKGFLSPCGACRQFMVEFGLDWDVYMLKPDLSYQKMPVSDLLPHAFSPQSLKEN